MNAITIYTATNKRYLNESTDLIANSVQRRVNIPLYDQVDLAVSINLSINHRRNETAKETICVNQGAGMLIV